MLNYIWGFMILIAVIAAFFTGRMDAVAAAAMEGAAAGINLVFEMLGVMCFWTGLMEIAQRAGLIRGIARLLRPLTRLLFPRLSPNGDAMEAIVMNISANLLGMSNAATPLGLRAMQMLDQENGGKKRASDAMCMFVLINTASIQLLPTTLILLRQNAGSQSPAEIMVPVWIVSVVALLCGVCSAKILQKRS